jgi:endoglucanase
VGRHLWVPETHASAAAAAAPDGPDKDLLSRLAAVPTAVWLTPERSPIGQVGDDVRALVTEASARGEVVVLVVYGIPRRDCIAGLSSGGLSPDSYLPWVTEIAEAAAPWAVVVVEPDALASAPECDLVDQRTHLLGKAARILAPHAPTYLDAGHAEWLDPATTADLLTRSSIADVRGFSVGVASYGWLDSERAFADKVSNQLGGASYVIDTGRSGAGPGDTWCNPTGRALGPEPATVDDGSAMDAMLWIKPPGESDGVCGGGPPAGDFWTERALELATGAGW